MAERPFVHLHCHTHYSLLDGASRIPELVELTKNQGMNALAITDHGNLYGAIEFYRECRDKGVNPIVGYEAYVAPGRRTEREAKRRGEAGFHLTLLAQNLTGFKNLVKMSSIAYLEGYHYVPRIDKELLEAHKEGLICLSGCASSEFSDYILGDHLDKATQLAEWFAKTFGKNFYVEIQNNGLEIQRQCAEGAVAIANRLGLPLVATCDAHYLRQGDHFAHDVLLCINTGRTLKDENRMRYGSDQFYVRPPEEMYKLFQGHEAAVKRSQEIADGCDIQLDFKKRHFPVFTPPDNKKAEDYLRELCELGFVERYGNDANDPRLTLARQRLEHELGIICRMGFAGYFLIVWDFVRFALSKNIPANARGSACGAIVSYVLRLSNVCPIEYDLLFERFLDPNRSEAPDIDIDFCQDRREEVISYVRQRYGENSVSQIGTFGTMAAKAAIKDVGRVMEIPLDQVNRLTAMVPKVLNISLKEAIEQSTDLRKEYESDPQIRKLIDTAMELEGTNRNAGTHAAGVVIANGPIIDYVPVQRILRKGYDNGNRHAEAVTTTQWVMGDIEKVGMLKMDFLGLRTLTVMENTIKLIKKTRNETVDLSKFTLDDAKTFNLLQRGDAKGVFQLESDGIRELLKRMKPDNIRDLIATNALYRPGPLGGGMVDAYVNRKHGREKPVYQHPIMEEILVETYGILVYQEQCMRVLNRLGGIELASAYACIKAISKKKQEIIEKNRAEFLKGAQERGLGKDVAEEIFGLIIQFAGYGFNKCLVGSTEIMNARTGERTTLLDLFNKRRPFSIHALGEDEKLCARRVTDVVWNGRKPVFELRTAQGKRIVATANHPFRTLNGWVELGQLKPGDQIAAPRRLTVSAKKHWPRHEIIVLAGLLSEGNTCHPTTLYFYGNERSIIDDFAEAANQFADSKARIYARPGGIRLEVCANTGQDARFMPGQQPWNSSHSAVATKAPPKRCGAFRWAKKMGLLGKKAAAKSVPAELFLLAEEDLELFLGRLWAGDGFFATEKLAVPYYATSSRCLARDVQTLLLRLGILSGIHAKEFKYRGGTRPGYTVHLLGEQSITTFCERVVPSVVGRETGKQLLLRYHARVSPGKTSKDLIPKEVRAWVNEERCKRNLTWQQLEGESGVSTRMFPGQDGADKRGFRGSTIEKLAMFFGSKRLEDAATSDIFWDRIVSIEPRGVEDTYDLTIDTDHNFVADGLIVHNSHSAAYAQIGYQTAYLKAHYTPEFMAALLSSEIEDSNKRDIMVEHIADARRLHVEVLPPDVQEGEPDFTVKKGKIVFGLTAIKGLGRGAAENIQQVRDEGGPFKDFFDFCERIDQKLVSKLAIEKLIKAGAFDGLCNGRRAALMEALPRGLQAAGQAQEDRRHGQRSLFEVFQASTEPAAQATEGLKDLAEWSQNDRLKFEKEALDFYITSHPLAQHEDALKRFSSHSIAQLVDLPLNHEVFLGGMLTQVRLMNTKKARNGNSRYVRCKLEDFSGSAECVMWPDDYVRFKDLIAEDKICFVGGVVERNRDEPGLQLNRILSVEQGQRERTTGLVLTFSLHSNPGQLEAVARVLERSPGTCPVFLYVQDAARKWLKLKAGEGFKINPATLVRADLETILGPGRVEFSRQGNGNGRS